MEAKAARVASIRRPCEPLHTGGDFQVVPDQDRTRHQTSATASRRAARSASIVHDTHVDRAGNVFVNRLFGNYLDLFALAQYD
jgi:hypothetical protein